jgi:exopolyphosphatase/guanosine-5'-triphosphate,3'-diphosphate pyrophosphatase
MTQEDGLDARTQEKGERIKAFMDIGTNSIRLLLVRFNENRSYTIISQQKEVVRLGEDEFVDQHLQMGAMRRAVLVCRTFTEMARAQGADEIVAIATSATREARNRDEFLRMLRQEAGLEVRPISGLEEARLIYLGVTSGFHMEERRAVFIDIGGGSTEIVVGDQFAYAHLDSLKLGAIRLTSMFFLPEEPSPLSVDRYSLIARYVRNATIRSVQRIREHEYDIAIGSSGTIENLADIAVRRFHGRPRQRDDVMTYAQLSEIVEMLCSLTLEERRNVPGINPDRADIIIAGAAILHTIMGELGLEEIRATDRGLREGLIIDALARSHPEMLKGLSVRERGVIQLGRACRFDEPHATTVKVLALQLFDSGRKLGLHKLGKAERELLGHASMLHDVGSFLSYSNHQAHTYYLIRNADLVGFDLHEVELIAAVARFHRKGYPRKKHPEYITLNKRSRRVVRVLSTLLRMAESLDRSHAGLITQAAFEKVGRKRAVLRVHASEPCHLELWGVQGHQRAFQRTFGRRLELRLVSEKVEADEVAHDLDLEGEGGGGALSQLSDGAG